MKKSAVQVKQKLTTWKGDPTSMFVKNQFPLYFRY